MKKQFLTAALAALLALGAAAQAAPAEREPQTGASFASGVLQDAAGGRTAVSLAKAEYGDTLGGWMDYFIFGSSFCGVGGGTFPYPNSNYPAYFTEVSDGRYTVSITGADGCLAYTRFVAKVVWGTDGAYSKVYPEEGAGALTGAGVQAFLARYAQPGEHLRIDGVHSLTYAAMDAAGFYYLNYLGDSNPHIYLMYMTWQQFADACNAAGRALFLYNCGTADTVVSVPSQPTAVPEQPAETAPAPSAVPQTDGWTVVGGNYYWYEGGVLQGTEGRGREIYDPASGAWYWLDAAQGGAMAVSQDVYQESSGGKWVRYDAYGHMVKGWQTTAAGAYYFDPTTGAMAKGALEIGGRPCWFDETTGIGLNLTWKTVDGRDYWYEGGVRQGYDPNDPSYRGKETYDPASGAWYWLDNVQQGAKAVSKDVYQESSGGKWVRYDADGHMVKGWQTTAAGTWYFDPVTGAMAKGTVAIDDGKIYRFDPVTGLCG